MTPFYSSGMLVLTLSCLAGCNGAGRLHGHVLFPPALVGSPAGDEACRKVEIRLVNDKNDTSILAGLGEGAFDTSRRGCAYEMSLPAGAAIAEVSYQGEWTGGHEKIPPGAIRTREPFSVLADRDLERDFTLEWEDVTYDEQLSTVLRAVRIDDAAAGTLGFKAGYYELVEFRVSSEPSKRAIALALDKGYGVCVDPSRSILPRSSDPWVFSKIMSQDYDAAHRRETIADWYGHVLSFDITFGATCNTSADSKLSGVSVDLTTKSYTTDAFNTCDRANEPPITGRTSSCLCAASCTEESRRAAAR